MVKCLPIRSWSLLAFLSVATFGAGCGEEKEQSDGGIPVLDADIFGNSSMNSTLSAAEQKNGGCPSTPERLVGQTPVGGICARAFDCAPQCCACPGGGRRWAAAACVEGRCADSNTSCTVTADAGAYCN